MNQIKRQFDFNQSFDMKNKKLRTIFDEYYLINTCLENLSNELFYEIFDYLDGCDIYKAFSKLNIRFQNLLNYSLLPLKINFSSKSQSTLEHHCQHVIIPNKHRILSLHFNGLSVINDFFNYCNLDLSFNHLESIVLNRLSDYKLMMILFYLKSLPRLFSLTIELLEDSYYNMGDIFRLIFHLPSLKYSKLSLLDDEESEAVIPISLNEKHSTIEHLVIDFCCTLKEITSILYHTPYLRHLNCKRLIETNDIDTKEVLVTLPHLTHVSIIDCDVPFDTFEMFIKKFSSQLQVLRLNINSRVDYLNANRWKQMIKKHMPHLRQFHFDHHMCSDDDDDNVIPNHESINQFTSSFWTERQWFFELKNYFNELIYSIHPYQKTWYDCHKYEQLTTYSDRNIGQETFKHVNISRRQEFDNPFIQSIPPIQLTIEDHTYYTCDPLYIQNMKPCFIAVQFNHLNIDCHDISIDFLIEIIRLLPNLDSLNVSCLPLTQLNLLSTEDTEMLLLVSITNKITKVKLNKMEEMEQLEFLMNLCPRMEYLEMKCTTDKQLENIIGTISMKNITHIPYLCRLCLWVPNANEMIIQTLDSIVDFERLFYLERVFRDYEIRRIGNQIFFKWKL